ncbi:MAG TPA: hypothetical protein VMY59_08970 [Candidatus Thermoplasmatota archaeon]|nr:hypothetical protein [Candidatus Thermoplasmatota archaeon]
MRRLTANHEGSINPVLFFFMSIVVAGFLILILGEVLVPFFQLGLSTDSTISTDVSMPRAYAMSLLGYIWPKGVMLAILFGLIFWLLMSYQKRRYKESA